MAAQLMGTKVVEIQGPSPAPARQPMATSDNEQACSPTRPSNDAAYITIIFLNTICITVLILLVIQILTDSRYVRNAVERSVSYEESGIPLQPPIIKRSNITNNMAEENIENGHENDNNIVSLGETDFQPNPARNATVKPYFRGFGDRAANITTNI